MRALMLAENLPYPTFKGGDLRNWQNVVALRRLGDVAVFGLCSNDRRVAHAPANVAGWQCSADPALAFPMPPARVAAARRWLLEPEGHPADTYASPIAAAEIERLVADFRPEVVVIERLWLYRYASHARARGARVVLDAHNVETTLARQLADAEPADAPGRRIASLIAARTAAIEKRALADADQVWVCSAGDRARLAADHQRTRDVHVVPNGVDVTAYDARGTPPPALTTLVFPAMFTYAPNARAARFLVDELLPCLGDVRLVLVGAMPDDALHEAARRDPRITVTGAVPDVRPYVRAATAVVVPVFEGSGTRFKILEALAAGVPVITTTMGADGLDVEDGVHVLVANTAAEFAVALERLRDDTQLAARLALHGYRRVAERYSWTAAADAIAAALAEAVVEGEPS